MPRFTPMGAGVLPAHERHPLLTDTGRRTLDALVEAPDGPRWNHHCGDRLDRAALDRVPGLLGVGAHRTAAVAPGAAPPRWLTDHLDRVRRTVPRYRRPDAGAPTFTTSRDDLARAWWELVPDDVDLDDLIWFPTSGTGHAPVVVPTHPVAVSCYYPLLLEAARGHGVAVSFRGRPRRLDDRRQPAARAASRCRRGRRSSAAPRPRSTSTRPAGGTSTIAGGSWSATTRRSITGDPISLSHLADLDADLHPRVLVSTALTPHAGDAPAAWRSASAARSSTCTRAPSPGPSPPAGPMAGMGLLQPRPVRRGHRRRRGGPGTGTGSGPSPSPGA